ncbi:MAG: hypothetical protein Ct9H300mP21_04860 [Pseudomonadota bacterium]|nr:MAG: hypothetical protein Ct9H300mP21_04860 [Pseudomonadota bacterium]
MAFLKSGDHLLMTEAPYAPKPGDFATGFFAALRRGKTTYYDPLIGAKN